MTAKEYLLQLTRKREEIEYLNELLQDCIDKATSITARMDEVKVQASRTGSGMVEKYSIRAVEIEQEIENKAQELFLFENKIIEQIRGLHHIRYTDILYRVYVKNESVKQAAVEMGISNSYAIEVHKKALQAFREHYGRKKAVEDGTGKNTDNNE